MVESRAETDPTNQIKALLVAGVLTEDEGS